MGPAAYGLVFLILFAEAVAIPSPDELALFLAGLAVGRGEMNWFATVGASALGALCGAVVSYALARRLGRPLILHHGRRVGLTEERLRSVEGFLEGRGHWAPFLGRLVTGVRLVIGYASGLFGIDPRTFVAFSAAGAVTWSIIDVSVGALIGDRLPAILATVRAHLVPAIAVAVLVAAVLVLWHRRGVARPRGRRT